MWACVIVLGLLVLIYVTGVKFRFSYLEETKEKRQLLHILYPSIGYWLHKAGYFKSEAVKRKMEVYQSLHPGGDAKKIYTLDSCHKFSILYTILFVTSFFGILVQVANHDINLSEYSISRPVLGAGAKEQSVDVILKQDGKQTKEKFTFNIGPRKYSDMEMKQFKEEAKSYLLENLKGENNSLDEVQSPLNLLTKVPSNPYEVSWELWGQDLIMDDGTLNNKNIKERTFITIQVCLTYEKTEEYTEIPIGVMPYVWSWEEEARVGFLSMVQQQDENNREKELYKLPSKTDNLEISYVIAKEEKGKKLFFCGMLGCIASWVYWEEGIKKNKKRRDEECQCAYPNIVYKLTLLLGAGMTLRGAWQRTIRDYLKEKEEAHGKIRYVYEEMIITWNEMENGVPEIEAFSQFGKRMKLRSYLRFSSLITQNLKKGTKGFLMQLEAEAREAQEERKQLARRLGEEAGTKLLFPMLIMLIIVLAIVMIPAFLSFSKGGL